MYPFMTNCHTTAIWGRVTGPSRTAKRPKRGDLEPSGGEVEGASWPLLSNVLSRPFGTDRAERKKGV